MPRRVSGAIAALLLSSGLRAGSERELPGPRPDGSTRLPNGRLLTPAGTQTPVLPYPFALAVAAGGRRVVVAATGTSDQALHLLDAATGAEVSRAPLDSAWLGLAVSPDGSRAFVSGAGRARVLAFRVGDRSIEADGEIPVRDGAEGEVVPAGLAVSRDGGKLWVARMGPDDLVRVDLTARAVERRVAIGRYPYRPALSPDGRVVAVAAWGEAKVVLVDASTSSVVGTIDTADHPCDLVFSRDGRTLYVAQANRNLVAVADVASRKVLRQVSVAMGPQGPGTASADAMPDGSTPNALALSRDGRTLYVANADDDAVAVVDLSKGAEGARAAGFIPVGWYPAALALLPNGRTLFVANAKGSGSRANPKDGPDPTVRGRQYPPGSVRYLPGSVSRIAVPAARELARHSARAYANRKPLARGTPPPSSPVVPAGGTSRSPIRHVVYVIRENRTYDQVFGDLPQGNGDPTLAIFGREVTPNAHALAEEFVLFDAFFADAEVSADGHSWSTAAYATDFTEKTWVPSYGGRAFEYLWEGKDPTASPTAGYLWDAAARAGLTLRNYGEFVGTSAEEPPTTFEAPYEGRVPNLMGRTCPFYPGFDMDILDQTRVDLWEKELRSYVASGTFPALSIVRLGNDHTVATRRGAKTPRAMVADNDLALGRLVEALSGSPFWESTAIFVVEDDAQNGSDHVDAHRTVALVISPYTRRGGLVDSTLYSTSSMLRTMEMILGLPPLSQHDASATPMTAAFTDRPDLRPFRHRPAGIDLFELNQPGAPMQAASERWNFSREDAAPDAAFGEAVWKSVCGAGSVMPAPVNAAFVREAEAEEEAGASPSGTSLEAR